MKLGAALLNNGLQDSGFREYQNAGTKLFLLFQGPQVIDELPYLLLIRYFLFEGRHVVAPLPCFVKQCTVRLRLYFRVGKVTARGLKLGCFRPIALPFFPMAGGAMFLIQRQIGRAHV